MVRLLPPGRAAVRQLLGPLLGRLDRGVRETQLVIVTPDAETALTFAELAAGMTDVSAHGPPVVPITAKGRSQRLVRASTPLAVAGTAPALAELVADSALKVGGARIVVLAWVDDILAASAGDALETLFAELPKESARMVIAGGVTPAVEEVIERYARRARRIEPPTSDETIAPGTPRVSYMTVAARGRPAALRRLLDALDPASALIIARDPDSADEARAAVEAMGYTAGNPIIRVVETADTPAVLGVLYDVPGEPAELVSMTPVHPEHLVALVQPRQLAALRRAAAGGSVAPFTIPERLEEARAREERVRDSLRRELADAAPTREMLALEPLLDEFDAIEIAAVLLRMLESSKRGRRAAVEIPADYAVSTTQAPPILGALSSPASRTRIFLSVGSRDGAEAGSILGALTGESGISRQQIGRIELRDTHTLVEVDSDSAEQVVDKMTGTMIRGRRVVARVDKGRDTGAPPRERSDRAGSGRGSSDRFRGERPRGDRPGGDRPRGDRSMSDRPRGDRPTGDRSRGPAPRADRPRGASDGGERRPEAGQRGMGHRDERNASYGRTLTDERAEWASRGDRVRNARRPPRDKE